MGPFSIGVRCVLERLYLYKRAQVFHAKREESLALPPALGERRALGRQQWTSASADHRAENPQALNIGYHEYANSQYM